MKVWEWLSGKKTTIGATILLASAFCTQVVIGSWGAEQDWLPKFVETLDWVGGLITTGGLTHKLVRKKKK
jgi:hypothetical protein